MSNILLYEFMEPEFAVSKLTVPSFYFWKLEFLKQKKPEKINIVEKQIKKLTF